MCVNLGLRVCKPGGQSEAHTDERTAWFSQLPENMNDTVVFIKRHSTRLIASSYSNGAIFTPRDASVDTLGRQEVRAPTIAVVHPATYL